MSSTKKAKSNPPKFTYFAGRGRGETLRLIMALAGVEWESVYLKEKEQMDYLHDNDKLLYSQVPLLEIDGLCLVESSAIAVYLGRKYNLLGKTLDEEARVLMLFEGAKSFICSGIVSHFFVDDPEKRENMKDSFKKIAAERYLPAFEKTLKENGNGVLVGDSPTIADCALLDVLTNMTDQDFTKGAFDDFPKCKGFIATMSEVPAIKAYLTGPLRHPIADDQYVKEVRTALKK